MKTVALVSPTPFGDLPDLVQRLRQEFKVIEIPLGVSIPDGVDTVIIEGLVTSSHEGVPEWLWAGAGLDVYVAEPNVPSELLALDNVVCLPHIGSGTIKTRMKMENLLVDNILAVFAGKEPPIPVNQPM